jgi:RHS repeat-associated protein
MEPSRGRLTDADRRIGNNEPAIVDRLTTPTNVLACRRFASRRSGKGGYNPQDTWNYATYWQDSVSGLDYANNRNYNNAYGRFMTPDPYNGSSKPSNPQSWNRYNYGGDDPVNNNDPSGLDEGPPQLVCTIGAGIFYGEICYGFYSSLSWSVGGSWWDSGAIENAIAAAEAQAQAYLSIWTTTNQARGLLAAKLQSEAVSSNSNCMGALETMTGKSFNQLMQDANQVAFVDVTGPSGSLSPSQVGLANDSNATLSSEFAQSAGATAVTPLGQPIVLLGSQYFNGTSTFGNSTFNVSTPDSFKQSVLFHEFWHVEGIGHDDTPAASQAFNDWLNGGCKGQMPQ